MDFEKLSHGTELIKRGFVGSGIFKTENPEKMAKAVVEAVNYFDNPAKLAEISKGVGAGMKGISADMIPLEEALQERGW